MMRLTSTRAAALMMMLVVRSARLMKKMTYAEMAASGVP